MVVITRENRHGDKIVVWRSRGISGFFLDVAFALSMIGTWILIGLWLLFIFTAPVWVIGGLLYILVRVLG